MRLQNYGRLVKVEHFPEQPQSSRVLIKSSEAEAARNAIRSIEKSDAKENTNIINENNKATISTDGNRLFTTESEHIDDITNRISLESYSFNLKNHDYLHNQKHSVGETYGSMDSIESDNTQGDRGDKERGYSKIEYKLRVESLTRQYELKIRKQRQLHQLEVWRMGEQMNDLRSTVERLKLKEKALTPKEEKEEYCHICSNGEMIVSLNKINKQLEETHSYCIKNQNQCGIRMLQLQQESLASRSKVEQMSKENAAANQKIHSLNKLNKSLAEQLKQMAEKVKARTDDVTRQRERYQSRERQIRKIEQYSQSKQTQEKPKQKLERLSYNDISIMQNQNNGLLGQPHISKSIGNISSLASQYRRESASYMSGAKKQSEAQSLVERVKSLSTLNYRPVISRKERRYY